eukprot:CAMPEP_0171850078 /NCGR_PEP_ID=MMETSP0992-20121227/20084_1 /TAXON_ID=483369 /ORGANISM="non described non described, Strain CCMP2098" /LENGTH=166 /DNA_ID=CAMNT_0012469463 /DNA_START=257 /DNA_END=757 /DNA_ORIENTATION=-
MPGDPILATDEYALVKRLYDCSSSGLNSSSSSLSSAVATIFNTGLSSPSSSSPSSSAPLDPSFVSALSLFCPALRAVLPAVLPSPKPSPLLRSAPSSEVGLFGSFSAATSDDKASDDDLGDAVLKTTSAGLPGDVTSVKGLGQLFNRPTSESHSDLLNTLPRKFRL